MEWLARDREGNLISIGKSPFERGRLCTEISYANGAEKETLYYNPSDTAWGNSLGDRFSFKLLEGEDCVGMLRGKTKKTGFLRAYAYYEIVIREKVFLAYEVGLGKKGLFLCIYDGAELVAIIEKTLKVVNYRDVYTAYIADAKYLRVAIRFAIYYDITMFGDQMEFSVVDVKHVSKNTMQKEVLEKYDPTFIPRVKKMESDTHPTGVQQWT